MRLEKRAFQDTTAPDCQFPFDHCFFTAGKWVCVRAALSDVATQMTGQLTGR